MWCSRRGAKRPRNRQCGFGKGGVGIEEKKWRWSREWLGRKMQGRRGIIVRLSEHCEGKVEKMR